jgi:hypothetical protein
MAKQYSVRADLYVLAVALIVALASTASFAKPAHSRTHLAAHHKTQLGKIGPSAVSVAPFNHDRPDGKGQSGNQQGAHARIESKPAQGNVPANNPPVAVQRNARHDAKGGPTQAGNAHETSNGQPASGPNVPEFHMGDLGPVDTRITVLPRGDADAPHRQQQTKFKLPLPGNVYGNQNHAQKAPDVARNAIGIPNPSPHGIQSSDEPANLHLAVGDRGVVPAAVVKAAVGAETKANQELVRPGIIRAYSSPVTPSAAVNRGVINGSGMLRRGFAPAAVGGPPRIVVGISGTMFRPKR